ncbi:MAG: hypothetical protein JW797_14780 [Bradymonadales bacterium]|nr:hypothetical protein [Bradymonadales bacterium]
MVDPEHRARGFGADSRPGSRPGASFLPLLAALLWITTLACSDNLSFPPDRQEYEPELLPPLTCIPNLDGQIDADELQPAVDVPISYLISPAGQARAIDSIGALDPSDRRVWDWGADYASDQVVRLSASLLTGRWYAASFPTGQFVTAFDADGATEAVYLHDSTGLYLLGVASTDPDPPEGRTLLVYDTPILLYRFPLKPGDTWIATAEITDGLYRGLPYAGRDTYQVVVDGSGRLLLPDLTFTQALLVRTHTVLSPAVGTATSQRMVSFLFECYGEVARATSYPGESDEHFTSAMEVRRLGL